MMVSWFDETKPVNYLKLNHSKYKYLINNIKHEYLTIILFFITIKTKSVNRGKILKGVVKIYLTTDIKKL